MARKAKKTEQPTRDRILDVAQEIIYRQGFAATSIEQIVEAAGITKGAFFYYFKTKDELARALIERFAVGDRLVLETSLARAETLSEDPLQQLLIFVGLLLEVAEKLDESPQPGCMFATFCFEQGLFDEEINTVVSEAMLNWRRAVSEKIEAVMGEHPPASEVDVESLADMLTVLFEGAFVLTRSLKERGVFSKQLRHYRKYLQLLFG